MKKILLIIALLNTLIFAKIVNKDYDSNKLQSLAYTKWEKLDSKFKTKFLKDSKKYIPILLDKAKEPLEYVGENKLPKFILDRGDYAYIYLYLRYLEYKKYKKEILNTYISILDGLDTIETKYSNSFISVILAIVINNELGKNIENTIKSKVLDKNSAKKLLNIFSKYAIFDNSILIDGINSEFDFLNKILSATNIVDKKSLKSLGIDINIDKEIVDTELANYLVEKNEELRSEILDILQIKDCNEQKLVAKRFTKKLKAFRSNKQTIERLKKLNSSRIKFKNLSDSDREFLYDYIAKSIISVAVSLKMYINTNSDINKLNIKNKEVVKKLLEI